MFSEEPIEAMMMHEEVFGMLSCNNCDYKGKMSGWIQADDRKTIKFVCPECRAIEPVRNPES